MVRQLDAGSISDRGSYSQARDRLNGGIVHRTDSCIFRYFDAQFQRGRLPCCQSQGPGWCEKNRPSLTTGWKQTEGIGVVATVCQDVGVADNCSWESRLTLTEGQLDPNHPVDRSHVNHPG